jgi:N-acetylglucosamine kinase-like BadF-type ATPase
MTYIGIDGGGSTTRMFVQNEDSEPRYIEFPISLKVKNGDHASSAKTLLEMIDGMGDSHDLSIAIGLAGMSREENQEALKNAITALPEFTNATVHIEGDATLALKAALGGSREGVLLIAGTGSVAYAQSGTGSLNRVGGWGPETSDEGSGYWIGLRVLRHYLRMFISGNKKDEFFMAVTEALPEHVSSPREIANLLEREPLFPASLALVAFECADRSEGAMAIIREAADRLSEMIVEVSEKLSYPRQVYLSGSIAKHAIMVGELQKRLDAGRFQFITLDGRAPARKALEMARSLQQETERV